MKYVDAATTAEKISDKFNIPMAELVDVFAEIPASDVQPIRHGQWECVGHDDTTYWYRCSVCGHEEHDNMTKHDRYCSNCGVRMDLEDGDTNG